MKLCTVKVFKSALVFIIEIKCSTFKFRIINRNVFDDSLIH